MRYASMKETQVPPVHAANLVANSGNTAYGVEGINAALEDTECIIFCGMLSWFQSIFQPFTLHWYLQNNDTWQYHYRYVIMGVMASQITSLTIVYSTVYSGAKKTSKLRVTVLCVGTSPGTGEFPAQMASNAENVSIWWRRHIKL